MLVTDWFMFINSYNSITDFTCTIQTMHTITGMKGDASSSPRMLNGSWIKMQVVYFSWQFLPSNCSAYTIIIRLKNAYTVYARARAHTNTITSPQEPHSFSIQHKLIIYRQSQTPALLYPWRKAVKCQEFSSGYENLHLTHSGLLLQ